MTESIHAVAAQMAQEIHDHVVAPLEVTLQPDTALELAFLLQLAACHPRVTDAHRALIARFLDGVCDYFVHCPTVVDMIRRGEVT